MAYTEEQIKRLEGLHNRQSRYEIVASKGDVTLRVGYTVRKSRHGLLNTLRRYPESTVPLFCPKGNEMVTFLKPAVHGCTIGEWLIRFSGRTEREVILNGELQHITSKLTKAN